MPQIDPPYENDPVSSDNDTDKLVLGINAERPLSDIEIGSLLDSPVGSPPLEDIVTVGERVLFIVPDASRRSAAGQVINLVVRRLIANGTMPFDIAAIFANGMNPPVTEAEKREILTPFIARRLVVFQHNARDLMGLVHLGETKSSHPVRLNRLLKEYDHIITVGDVRLDPVAGFTGGRDLICPGLAAADTIKFIKNAAFDGADGRLKADVGPALLRDNPVHEAMLECSAFAPVSFAIHTIVNETGDAVALTCGEPQRSHEIVCEKYLSI